MPKHHCDAGDFSRMVCPEPCGTMHSYCSTCGSLQDECPNVGLALIPPQRCAPSEAELIAVLIGCLGRDDYLSDTVRAITKLYADQPTVAQVKAEAVREAVKAIRGAWDDSWNLRDPEDPETAYSVDVWLSKYADRIERGE